MQNTTESPISQIKKKKKMDSWDLIFKKCAISQRETFSKYQEEFGIRIIM